MDRLANLDFVNFQAKAKQLILNILKTTFFVVALMVLITNIFLEPRLVYRQLNSTFFGWNLSQLCEELTADALWTAHSSYKRSTGTVLYCFAFMYCLCCILLYCIPSHCLCCILLYCIPSLLRDLINQEKMGRKRKGRRRRRRKRRRRAKKSGGTTLRKTTNKKISRTRRRKR